MTFYGTCRFRRHVGWGYTDIKLTHTDIKLSGYTDIKLIKRDTDIKLRPISS